MSTAGTGVTPTRALPVTRGTELLSGNSFRGRSSPSAHEERVHGFPLVEGVHVSPGGPAAPVFFLPHALPLPSHRPRTDWVHKNPLAPSALPWRSRSVPMLAAQPARTPGPWKGSDCCVSPEASASREGSRASADAQTQGPTDAPRKPELV